MPRPCWCRATRFDPARAKGIDRDRPGAGKPFSFSERLGFRALSICTVVDDLETGEETALGERHELFRDITRLAPDVATLPD